MALFVCLTFGMNLIGPLPQTQAQIVPSLPSPGVMVPLSPGFAPAILKGVKIFPDNPLRFDFIIDTGDSGLKKEALKEESTKLIKYFLASLTVPDKDMWVNLSPYEKDRIVPEAFGVTEMGRDLLAQDYLLKQITSSLMYPEEGLGKRFWDKVYSKAYEVYGTTDIPVNTFNKVWIVPEKAVVYEKGDRAFVTESHLKVMLEEDYLALKENADNEEIGTNQLGSRKIKELSSVSSEIVREVILPEIEKEVNEGKNFAELRQIYHSLILATWFKRNLIVGTGRDLSLLGKLYVGKNKVEGVDIEDKQAREKIYQQYLEAFKKGVYDYIKEDYDSKMEEVTARRHFSGGAHFGDMAMFSQGGTADQVQVDKAMMASVNLVPGKEGIEEKAEIKGTVAVLSDGEDERSVRLDFSTRYASYHRIRRIFPTSSEPNTARIQAIKQRFAEITEVTNDPQTARRWSPKMVKIYSKDDYARETRASGGHYASHVILPMLAEEIIKQGYLTPRIITEAFQGISQQLGKDDSGIYRLIVPSFALHFTINDVYEDSIRGEYKQQIAFVCSLGVLLENKVYYVSPFRKSRITGELEGQEDFPVTGLSNSLFDKTHRFDIDELGMLFIPAARRQEFEELFARVGRLPRRVHFYEEDTLKEGIEDFFKIDSINLPVQISGPVEYFDERGNGKSEILPLLEPDEPLHTAQGPVLAIKAPWAPTNQPVEFIDFTETPENLIQIVSNLTSMKMSSQLEGLDDSIVSSFIARALVLDPNYASKLTYDQAMMASVNLVPGKITDTSLEGGDGMLHVQGGTSDLPNVIKPIRITTGARRLIHSESMLEVLSEEFEGDLVLYDIGIGWDPQYGPITTKEVAERLNHVKVIGIDNRIPSYIVRIPSPAVEATVDTLLLSEDDKIISWLDQGDYEPEEKIPEKKRKELITLAKRLKQEAGKHEGEYSDKEGNTIIFNPIERHKRENLVFVKEDLFKLDTRGDQADLPKAHLVRIVNVLFLYYEIKDIAIALRKLHPKVEEGGYVYIGYSNLWGAQDEEGLLYQKQGNEFILDGYLFSIWTSDPADSFTIGTTIGNVRSPVREMTKELFEVWKGHPHWDEWIKFLGRGYAPGLSAQEYKKEFGRTLIKLINALVERLSNRGLPSERMGHMVKIDLTKPINTDDLIAQKFIDTLKSNFFDIGIPKRVEVKEDKAMMVSGSEKTDGAMLTDSLNQHLRDKLFSQEDIIALGNNLTGSGVKNIISVMHQESESKLILKVDHKDHGPIALKIAYGGELEGSLAWIGKLQANPHQNLQRIYDFGVTGTITWWLQEWVQGEPLFKFLQQIDILPIEDVRSVMKDLRLALSHLRGLGLNREDINPGNLILQRDETETLVTKLIDHETLWEFERINYLDFLYPIRILDELLLPTRIKVLPMRVNFLSDDHIRLIAKRYGLEASQSLIETYQGLFSRTFSYKFPSFHDEPYQNIDEMYEDIEQVLDTLEGVEANDNTMMADKQKIPGIGLSSRDNRDDLSVHIPRDNVVDFKANTQALVEDYVNGMIKAFKARGVTIGRDEILKELDEEFTKAKKQQYAVMINLEVDQLSKVAETKKYDTFYEHPEESLKSKIFGDLEEYKINRMNTEKRLLQLVTNPKVETPVYATLSNTNGLGDALAYGRIAIVLDVPLEDSPVIYYAGDSLRAAWPKKERTETDWEKGILDFEGALTAKVIRDLMIKHNKELVFHTLEGGMIFKTGVSYDQIVKLEDFKGGLQYIEAIVFDKVTPPLIKEIKIRDQLLQEGDNLFRIHQLAFKHPWIKDKLVKDGLLAPLIQFNDDRDKKENKATSEAEDKAMMAELPLLNFNISDEIYDNSKQEGQQIENVYLDVNEYGLSFHGQGGEYLYDKNGHMLHFNYNKNQPFDQLKEDLIAHIRRTDLNAFSQEEKALVKDIMKFLEKQKTYLLAYNLNSILGISDIKGNNIFLAENFMSFIGLFRSAAEAYMKTNMGEEVRARIIEQGLSIQEYLDGTGINERLVNQSIHLGLLDKLFGADENTSFLLGLEIENLIIQGAPAIYRTDVRRQIAKIEDKKKLLYHHQQHPLLTRLLLAKRHIDYDLYSEMDDEYFDRFVRLLKLYPQDESLIYFMVWHGLRDVEGYSIERLVEFASKFEPKKQGDYVYLYRGQRKPLKEEKDFLSSQAREHGLEKSKEEYRIHYGLNDRVIPEAKRILEHRTGQGKLFGVSFTPDFFAAVSFADRSLDPDSDLSKAVIYRVKVHKTQLQNANRILENSGMPDPISFLDDTNIQEYIIWHTLSRDTIVDTIPYPFKWELRRLELAGNTLNKLDEDASHFNFADWRKTKIKEALGKELVEYKDGLLAPLIQFNDDRDKKENKVVSEAEDKAMMSADVGTTPWSSIQNALGDHVSVVPQPDFKPPLEKIKLLQQLKNEIAQVKYYDFSIERIIGLAKEINPEFKHAFTAEELININTYEDFRAILNELKYLIDIQIFIPNMIRREETVEFFEHLARLDFPDLNFSTWLLTLSDEESDEAAATTLDWFGFINEAKFLAESHGEYDFIFSDPQKSSRYLYLTKVPTIKKELMSYFTQNNLSSEWYARNRYRRAVREEVAHTRDAAVTYLLEGDYRFGKSNHEQLMSRAQSIAKKDFSDYSNRRPSHSLFPADGLLELSGKLQGVINVMEQYRRQGNFVDMKLAFLDFIFEQRIKQYGLNEEASYQHSADFFFGSLERKNLITDEDILSYIDQTEEGQSPEQRALDLLKEVYFEHFLTDNEIKAKLKEFTEEHVILPGFSSEADMAMMVGRRRDVLKGIENIGIKASATFRRIKGFPRFRKLKKYFLDYSNPEKEVRKAIQILQNYEIIFLEIACGDANVANQIATHNEKVGVIATDIFNFRNSTLGYAEYAEKWEAGELEGQVHKKDNLAILRAEALDIFDYIPDNSLNYILLANPVPHVSKSLLSSLEYVSKKIKPGGQIIIKPYFRDSYLEILSEKTFKVNHKMEKFGFDLLRAIDGSYMSQYDLYVGTKSGENSENILSDTDLDSHSQIKNEENMALLGRSKTSKDINDSIGGIDFNPEMLDLETQGSDVEFDLPFDSQNSQNFEDISINGFTPVIFKIVPITNLPAILGSSEKEDPSLLKTVDQQV